MSDARCLYCDADLGSKTTEAHVIPSALGGKLSSTQFCCSDCNVALSRLEKKLCDALRGVTAMAGVRTGRRKDAPALRVVDPEHGPMAVWGGHPKFLGTRPTVSPSEDGQVRFHVSAANVDSAALDIAHLLRQYGKTPDDLEAGKAVTFTASEELFFLDEAVEFEAGIDIDEHARVLAKMPLELLAAHRPELARRGELRTAAAFVRFGSSNVDVSADTTTSGPLGRMRPFWHSCEVWSAGTSLIGKVVLFGAYPVSVALTAEWGGGPVTAVHVVDPVAGRVLFDEASSEDGLLPAGWPERGADLDVLQLRLNDLARAFDARMRAVTATTSARTVMRTWTTGLGGRAPTREDFVRLNGLVEEECARLRSRRSETAPIQTADLFRRVRQEYARLEREYGCVRKR